MGKKQSHHPWPLPPASSIPRQSSRSANQLLGGETRLGAPGRHMGQGLREVEVFDVCLIYLFSSHLLGERPFLWRSDKPLSAPACPPLLAPFSARRHLVSMHQKAPAYIPARLPSLPCLRNTAGVPWKQPTELPGSAEPECASEKGEGQGMAPEVPQEPTRQRCSYSIKSPLPLSQLGWLWYGTVCNLKLYN